MKRHVSEMLKTAKPAMKRRNNCELIELQAVFPGFLPPCEVPLTGCGCVDGCVLGQTSKFAQSQNTPLFLKEKGSAREKKTFFLVKKKLSFPLASNPFTLIELLVVIAIIAILAGMLMPALGKARDRGKTALCAGNMKVFGQANALYMDANNDWIVPSCHPPFGKNNNWAHDDVWAGLLGGYGRNSDYGLNYKKGVARGGVLKCPSEPLGYNSGQYYNSFFHYAINAGLSGLWWETGWTSYWRKQTQIDHPTKTILFGEVYAGKGGKGGSFNVKAILDLSYRHGAVDPRLENAMPTSGSAVGYYSLSGGTNVTYLDGHVATRKIQDFPADNVQAAMTSANKEECGFDRRKGHRFTTK